MLVPNKFLHSKQSIPFYNNSMTSSLCWFLPSKSRQVAIILAHPIPPLELGSAAGNDSHGPGRGHTHGRCFTHHTGFEKNVFLPTQNCINKRLLHPAEHLSLTPPGRKTKAPGHWQSDPPVSAAPPPPCVLHPYNAPPPPAPESSSPSPGYLDWPVRPQFEHKGLPLGSPLMVL